MQTRWSASFLSSAPSDGLTELLLLDMPLQGLGKTVQIISFLSILFAKENCLPFLVVVRLLSITS